jgi:hypothetical protein
MPKGEKSPRREYIVDAKGKRLSVVMPVEEFDELMQDVEDLAAVAERRAEPTVDHAEVVKRLRADGLL